MGRKAGKIIGGLLGLIAGGPVWGIIGLIFGHLRDIGAMTLFGASSRGEERGRGQSFGMLGREEARTERQSAFTSCVIVLGAKLAKCDGRVSRDEVESFKRVFNVPPHQVAIVGRTFDRARETSRGYEPYAARLAGMFAQERAALEEVLGGLFRVAVSDSVELSPPEVYFLRRVAVIFGLNEQDFERIALRSGVRVPGSPKTEARDENYAVLGVPESASDDEIKRTYRALIRKHHPDRLTAQGLPPELVSQATEKMKRINAAYDQICRKRGIK